MQPRIYLGCLLLLCALFAQQVTMPIQPSVAATASNWPTVAVKGTATTWQLTLLQLRRLDKIPGTAWHGYSKHVFTFWVLSLRMKNTGQHAANIADDIGLTLRVLPKYRTYATPGWTILDRSSPLSAGALKAFGGAAPWTVTQPGLTTSYTYVIGARYGERHYGLYNFLPLIGYTLLFDLGQ